MEFEKDNGQEIPQAYATKKSKNRRTNVQLPHPQTGSDTHSAAYWTLPIKPISAPLQDSREPKLWMRTWNWNSRTFSTTLPYTWERTEGIKEENRLEENENTRFIGKPQNSKRHAGICWENRKTESHKLAVKESEGLETLLGEKWGEKRGRSTRACIITICTTRHRLGLDTRINLINHHHHHQGPAPPPGIF